jgi:hypothetical protein
VIGYITSVGRTGTDGFLQQEGNFPIDSRPDWWGNTNLGRYEFNSSDTFAVGQRVVFDADGPATAINVRPA